LLLSKAKPLDYQDDFIIISNAHLILINFTSQLPVDEWYDASEENTLADAIPDRLVHTAHRSELPGEWMRGKKKSVILKKFKR